MATARKLAPIRGMPGWTRVLHVLDLAVLLLMAGSGLQIYNANPVFGGREGATVPELFTLGGWLAGGRDWHFGLMGLYAANLAVWIVLLFDQRRRRLADAGDLERLRASENRQKRRLSAHRLVYSLMLVVLGFSLITGLAMYKPAQFWWLSGLFSFAEPLGISSWQTLRVSHLATIPAMLLLTISHAVLSWRVGGLRLLRGMFL
ncbi:cytochrome b/b6 domain-containing protein [Synechococcus sp. CS-602]|uniref:cytochrome b/b6 domain-containing protein n=1 Tax=Synechococcaceae TaxID=1890426 RepID=UPI0008FF6F76|nr:MULTISPECIES: cytochrome b/b6 domain-containing protein [Synechococcaceae]MCT4364275.1 cytochrome b/b6 domain-containing protein [Candidatus Regnicoccus frigidus MAG-AL1]APD48915.1 thiosulfate reductase cytochrome B subunit (membrane anchoring protein) [Synechococcus sp. SynAce01]MCT0203723.1 cytochrome b/b6 domain-containing protein [Synechococcus sp. CS-602]MCT0246412.1 cytochrome b/b6 domain-containing protein [Synechococcus sp. CS-601]MCT4367079.1 cytochrome b/b6 domain-containing prote